MFGFFCLTRVTVDQNNSESTSVLGTDRLQWVKILQKYLMKSYQSDYLLQFIQKCILLKIRLDLVFLDAELKLVSKSIIQHLNFNSISLNCSAILGPFLENLVESFCKAKAANRS